MGAALQLSPEEVDRLEALAARTGRPAEVLRREAITRYVDDELRQLEELEEGLADLEAGRVVDHEVVAEWLRSWGTPNEGPAPK